jgi:hypothetical protein
MSSEILLKNGSELGFTGCGCLNTGTAGAAATTTAAGDGLAAATTVIIIPSMQLAFSTTAAIPKRPNAPQHPTNKKTQTNPPPPKKISATKLQMSVAKIILLKNKSTHKKTSKQTFVPVPLLFFLVFLCFLLILGST